MIDSDAEDLDGIPDLASARDDLERRLVAQAEVMLGACGLGEAELSLVLCSDATITELNARYLGKDEPTDVLSFSQDDPGFPGQPRVLGDVVISVERAAVQASEQGHGLEAELAVLLTHGLCHLLGHTHDGPDDTARMAAEELRLLEALGGGTGLVERAAAAAAGPGGAAPLAPAPR